jgi:hypothetical protein
MYTTVQPTFVTKYSVTIKFCKTWNCMKRYLQSVQTVLVLFSLRDVEESPPLERAYLL